MDTAFQRPVIASIFQALLLGLSTTVGISVKDTLDPGSTSNFVYFVVVCAAHFGVLTLLTFMFGYGGGMIASEPAKKTLSERYKWWLKGSATDSITSSFI